MYDFLRMDHRPPPETCFTWLMILVHFEYRRTVHAGSEHLLNTEAHTVELL